MKRILTVTIVLVVMVSVSLAWAEEPVKVTIRDNSGKVIVSDILKALFMDAVTNNLVIELKGTQSPLVSTGLIPLMGDWNGNGTQKFGVYKPDNATFYLKNDAGLPDTIINYGNLGDIPVVGDWDKNGTTTIGVFRPGHSTFYLRNSNTPGGANLIVSIPLP